MVFRVIPRYLAVLAYDVVDHFQYMQMIKLLLVAQKTTHQLNIVMNKYNMKISVKKTQCMAFVGPEPLRVKISINNEPVEQVSTFRFLGCEISYRGEVDIDKKLNNFNRMNGTIFRTLKGKVRKNTMMKFYRSMSIPAVTYGSETWTITNKNMNLITAAEMRFLRKVQGVTLLDRNRSEDIRNNLSQKPLYFIIKDRKTNWKNHLQRMDYERLLKKVLSYKAKGKRPIERPMKRRSDK